VIRLAVAAHEKPPVLFGDGGAFQPAKADSRIEHLAPFLADFLAFVMAELREEGTKIGVIVVLPVELPSLAQQEPVCGEAVAVGFCRKQNDLR